MRKIEITENKLHIKENVEIIYEENVTPFGNSAKIGSKKEYIGKRAYVIIIKD
ncbi:MAG: DUF2080 family transposase-associated protein [Thermoplasmata archaeon]